MVIFSSVAFLRGLGCCDLPAFAHLLPYLASSSLPYLLEEFSNFDYSAWEERHLKTFYLLKSMHSNPECSLRHLIETMWHWWPSKVSEN